ncbi:MAG: trehalose-phosphatase, partial [Xanthomonadales bacterium]|nr:trehalose-phosphatase [Xanthomonadales bacterium]
HNRQAPQHEAALAKATAALARRFDGYALQPGNKVFEIKPTGSDKGQAVRRLLREPPFRDRVPVYLGDDLTDEHAFAVINACAGISVRVGSRTPTQALFTLDNVVAAHTWLRACLGTPHAHA